MRRIIPLLLIAAVLAGCTWGIKLDDAGRQMQTDWNGPMDQCQRLGRVTVSVADHVGPFSRNDIKVRDELEVMARNEAGDMDDADTIHPLEEAHGGAQKWGVYQCRGRRDAAAGDAAEPAGSSSGMSVQTYPVESHSG